jgi:Mlc titration factor MtfA (ptsG expression regulator)
MATFWQAWRRSAQALIAGWRGVPEIDPALWQQTLRTYPFLSALAPEDQDKLRTLCSLFLQQKEFHGAHGLQVSDAMALQVAAQACVPLLHWGPPERALRWYDDFVGIVLHPGPAVAQREAMDEAGVVHRYSEVLTGEAMQQGPVMLSWPDVAAGAHTAAQGTNVVIHEFAHKLDMRDGAADGCPPLPKGFMGAPSAKAARARWHATWAPAYEAFRERVILAERFGADWPWLDAYAATGPAEFFAVACEAYFVNRTRFAQEFVALVPLLEAFFEPERT